MLKYTNEIAKIYVDACQCNLFSCRSVWPALLFLFTRGYFLKSIWCFIQISSFKRNWSPWIKLIYSWHASYCVSFDLCKVHSWDSVHKVLWIKLIYSWQANVSQVHTSVYVIKNLCVAYLVLMINIHMQEYIPWRLS
jgi:hypothetical protein